MEPSTPPSRPGSWFLGLVVAGGLAATLFSADTVWRARKAGAEADFEADAQTRIRLVAAALTRTADELVALQSLYLASEEVTEEEFLAFTANLFANRSAGAVAWVPRVPAERRGAFETELGRPVEELADEELVSAKERAEYFPVRFVTPLPRSARAEGFDLHSEPRRAATLDAAWQEGKVRTTGLVELVVGGKGLLSVAPVFKGPASTPEERHRSLVGFVSAMDPVDRLLAGAFADLPLHEGIVVSLYEGDELVGRYPPGAAETNEPFVEETLAMEPGHWRVRCAHVSGYGAGYLATALTTGAGVAFTGLVAAYVRLLAARTSQADAQARRLSAEIAERKRAEAEARESEAKFRALAEEAQVGVYLLQDRRFRYVNPTMARLIGRFPEEMVDRTTADLLPDSPALAEALSDPGVRRELTLREADGGERLLEIYATGTSIDGRPAVLGTVLDVTERRRAEAERHRLERLQSLGVLAGGIAHDFNNLLAAILGNVSLAELDLDPGSAASSRLREAFVAIGRAQGLTTQLSTFSRGGAPVLAPTDMGDLVQESVRLAITDPRVRCELDIPADLWAVQGDADQIARVLHNLLLNAVQAMPDGGRVRVRARNETRDAADGLAAGRYVAVSVRDEGIGMTPDVRDHVFDPYFTTKSGGQGLGLASAHSIVRRHRGSIDVRSVPGQGSTFTVRFPVSEGHLHRVAEAAAAAAQVTGHILVMDDDDSVRAATARLLESLGHRVEQAADGGAAVELYRAARAAGHPFDAVILDLTVPEGMGGREAVQRLRAIDPAVRAVASSGYSDDPILSDHTRFGFDAALPKPYRREDLGAVVANLLAVPWRTTG